MTTTLFGSCHCAQIRVELATGIAPPLLPRRRCGCTFCLRHNPRYTSDPGGHLTIRFAREEDVIRYRFGLRLGDFLLCARCGVFVAAFEGDRGVLNSLVLDRAAELTSKTTRFEAYDSEDGATRRARRARVWTPCSLEIA
jgi:hypothetical protein